MKLYKLESSNFSAFFGTPEERIERDVITIAQTPSCDAFLLLTIDTFDQLELLMSQILMVFCLMSLVIVD